MICIYSFSQLRCCFFSKKQLFHETFDFKKYLNSNFGKYPGRFADRFLRYTDSDYPFGIFKLFLLIKHVSSNHTFLELQA